MEPSPEIMLVYPPDEPSVSNTGAFPMPGGSGTPVVKMETDTDSDLLNAPPAAALPPDATIAAKGGQPSSVLAIAPVPEGGSVGKVGGRRRFTAEQRHERLKADPRIIAIEPHQLQCGLCNKWIRLQSRTEYDIHNWLAHVDKCELRQK